MPPNTQKFLTPNGLICVVIIAIIVTVYWVVFRGRARQYYLLFVGIVTIPMAEIVSRSVLNDPAVTLVPVYSIIFAVLSLCIWAIGRQLARGVKLGKLIFFLSIAFCVLFLSYFKYRHLLYALSATLFPVMYDGGSFVIRWGLPLGISYYIFRMISYLVDSYRGEIKSARLHEFGLYTFFFPIFVAGPIQRFGPFQKEIPNTFKAKPEYISVGCWRILLAALKKVVIADAILSNQIKGMISGDITYVTAGKLWVKSYMYAMYIYMDFSALSDIAIGVSLLFGIKIMENFNWPYLVTNISRFWQRWHISLTSWLTDYLFKPLTRRVMKTPLKKSPLLAATVGYTVTMVVCGVWHGADLGFFYFGLYHGIGLAVWQAYVQFRRRFYPKRILPKHIGAVLAGLLTFHFICLSWPLFTRQAPIPGRNEMRADINGSWELMKRMLFITKAEKKVKHEKTAQGGSDARETKVAGRGHRHSVHYLRDAGRRNLLFEKPGIGVHLHGILAAQEGNGHGGRHEIENQGIHRAKVQTRPRAYYGRRADRDEYNRLLRHA